MIFYKASTLEAQTLLIRYQKELGLALHTVIRDRHRIRNQRIMKALPPKTKSQGTKRVRWDLRWAANPLDPNKFSNKRFGELIRKNNLPALNAIIKTNRDGWKADRVEAFEPVRQHKRRRDRRGRIRSNKKLRVTGITAWRRYLRERVKAVGTLKSGYALGIIRTGGRVAKWILVNAGKTGTFTNRLYHPKNPRLITLNKVDYATDYGHTVRWATQVDTIAMEKDIRRKLAILSAKTGLDRRA